MKMHNLRLRVHDVIRDTFDAVTIIFNFPLALFSYEVGQFLQVCTEIEGALIGQQYALVSLPFRGEQPAVTVRRTSQDLLSKHLFDHVRTGDLLLVSGPYGNLNIHLNPDNQRHLVMIGDGGGLVPLLSLSRAVLLQEPSSQVTLFCANRDLAKVFEKEQLCQMQSQWPTRFQALHVLEYVDDYPVADIMKGLRFMPGRLNVELLQHLLHNCLDTAVTSCEYYVCGNDTLLETALSSLWLLNVPYEQVKHERFGSEV